MRFPIGKFLKVRIQTFSFTVHHLTQKINNSRCLSPIWRLIFKIIFWLGYLPSRKLLGIVKRFRSNLQEAFNPNRFFLPERTPVTGAL